MTESELFWFLSIFWWWSKSSIGKTNVDVITTKSQLITYLPPASIRLLLNYTGGWTDWGFPNLDIYITKLPSPLILTNTCSLSHPVSLTLSKVFICLSNYPSFPPALQVSHRCERVRGETGDSSLTSFIIILLILLSLLGFPSLDIWTACSAEQSVTRELSTLGLTLVSHHQLNLCLSN